MKKFSWTGVIKPNIIAFRFLGLWPKGSGSYQADFYTLYSSLIVIFLFGAHALSQILNIFVVSSALVVTVAFCLSVWCSFPFLDEKKQLPFACWYPFGTETSPKYEITYLHQVVSICCLATANLGLDTLISALMMFVGGQCDILCDNLRSLRVDNFCIEFVKCVKHHKDILR
jgi:hypothetical protein